MTEKLKLSDYEISMLIIERDTAQFKREKIDELLNQLGAEQGFNDAEKKPTREPTQEIALPGSGDISKLPWKSYSTKQAARDDEAGWVFRDTRGAETLVASLRTKDKIHLGNFEYQFSGKEHQFISRKPIK